MTEVQANKDICRWWGLWKIHWYF